MPNANIKIRLVDLLFFGVLVLIFFPLKTPLPLLSSTHTFSKILFLIFPPLVLYRIVKANPFPGSWLMLLGYLTSATLSSFFSTDSVASLKSIFYLYIGVVTYLSIRHLGNKQHFHIYFLMISILGSLQIIYSVIVAINPDLVFSIDRSLLQTSGGPGIFQTYLLDHRIFPLMPLHMIIPIYFYLYVRYQYKKFGPFILLLIVFSLVSVAVTNWRSLFIAALFSVSGAYILIWKRSAKLKMLAILISFIPLSLITSSRLGTNIFKRLSLTRKADQTTAALRISYFGESLSYFKERPIIGFGYGNYEKIAVVFNNIGIFKPNLIMKLQTRNIYENNQSAHDFLLTNLVETGLLGSLFWLSFIFYSIISDVLLLVRRGVVGSNYIIFTASVVSSWTFIVANLTESVLYGSSLVLFLFFRGITDHMIGQQNKK